jgi:catechol-2,3-dioxygenase
LAVLKVPEDQPVGSSGLSHTAFEIEGGLEQLREPYGRLKARGAEPEMTVDFVSTKSLFLLDPDGNRLELFWQVIPLSEAKSYLHEGGVSVVLQPLDLETVAR